MKTVAMISLGCPKNQVDGEIMLASLGKAGYKIVGGSDEEHIDCMIINTCGFIDDAKKEAIDAILDAAELKSSGFVSKILVTGCLAERYKGEVLAQLPEIDGILGIGSNASIVETVGKLLEDEQVQSFDSKYCLPLNGDRLLSTPKHTAYLKIAEGCSNCCAYCAIPAIRGKFRSRHMQDIIAEAEALVSSGTKELVIIAQDITKYGIDLYGSFKLAALLKKLSKIENLHWIRLLYCYPDAITDELIETIANESKICKYIDIPLQHASKNVLERMNRTGDGEEYLALINKLRSKIPSIVIRTTFIAGFPGETEEEFENLLDFVKSAKFDRMGCFPYSAEEGTVAAKMENQIEESVKLQRAEIIMNTQLDIFRSSLESRIGQELEVIVDEFDENDMLYYGRSYADCLEIDSRVIISTEDELVPGDFVNVKIIGVDDDDLVGEVVKI